MDELKQIADALAGINEKMERFVVAIEATKKTNDQWMDGRVTIDVHTHTALLNAVQKLSGHFDKWFELQTKPLVVKTTAERCLDDISDALTAAVDVQDARKMGEEIRDMLRMWVGDESVVCRLNDILKKYGYGPKETRKDQFRDADRWTRCPKCKEMLGWNDENGLEGQECGCCSYVFTGNEHPSGCNGPEDPDELADREPGR
jgi:hypothetical protein